MKQAHIQRIVCTWLSALSFPLHLGAAEATQISNGRIQVGISETGQLVKLMNERPEHNFASTNAPALWSLRLVSGAKTNALDASSATRFDAQRLSDDPRKLRLTWDGFGGVGVAGLRVDAVVRLDPNEAVSRWELSVQKPRDSALEEVRFPRLSGIPPQTNEVLAVPAWMGQMLLDPRKALAGSKGQGARYSWEYPGTMSLQCMAFYQEDGPGLYLACDDAAGFRKSFAVRGDGKGGIEFEISHLPENGARGAEGYPLGYGAILGTFRGDWITAAERYRAWAKEQPWAKQSRLGCGLVPEWATKTALWVWNRGRSPGVLEPAVALQRELGLPVSVLWHWWHGCSYDAGFPEYLPPREGADPFRKALARAHESDVHALVYMNQRLWGVTTKSWRDEGAERFAVRGPNGAYKEEVYNTFTKQPCVSMCMGTAFWRNKYAGLAERAIKELGVDGIYMDQACSSLACFDPAHGHPLGGGTYWMKGFRQLSGDIRGRCKDARPIALAGEGCGEPWLPYLDLMLSLEVSRERYAAPTVGWETIPFFQAVYHAHAIQFGNYSSLTMPPYDDLWPAEFAPKEPLALLDRKYSKQFCLEQARAFAWGQQPTIANFQPSHLRDRPEEIAYALRLARIRQKGLKYLLHGEYLRPPELAVPDITADMSRLSIYAGQRGGLTEFQKRLPSVIAGAWRAPDGDVAIALASIADEPLGFTLPLDVTDRRVCRIDESGRTPLGQDAPGRPLEVSLPPRGACLIEITRE
ncbi:MAG TPA: DUF6259 domain-containing protein [Verrucomicrobiae bacterium]|nr:DUF6259 domain-containing protein [Verrucomicrobiae bacterium]